MTYNVTSEQATEWADKALANYGSSVSVELADGYTLRGKVESDDLPTLDQNGDISHFGDCYGTTAWREQNRHSEHTEPRPANFDGNAEVIPDNYYRHAALWWQPPTDVKRGTAQFDAVRTALLELLDNGYSYFTVSVTRECNACGKDREVATGSLSGIDGLTVEYLASEVVEVLEDVCGECGQ